MTAQTSLSPAPTPAPTPASTPAASCGSPAAAGKPTCPVDAVLRLLMGPWTTYPLYVLRTQGPRRFGELKREVTGISARSEGRRGGTGWGRTCRARWYAEN